MRGIERVLEPVLRRIRSLVTRVRLTATQDSDGLQLVALEALAGERLPRVVRLQQFGSSGHAPVGSTGLMVAIGGARSASLLIAIEHPASRPRDLAEGEYRIYNAFGDFVHLKANGEIHVKASNKVVVEAPEAEFTGNVAIAGNLTVGGDIGCVGTVTGTVDVIAAGISGKDHTHNETGTVTDGPNP